ncbi:MAG: endolytic transglycosylase MltG [Rhodospirillaceae bacterium]|nr:endolytic transglycosylase MltG [Rhodospirillaceae bacterium]MYB15185.1 endolytic transglycosylase MltG [Rhodospirillaceae bacterium]MYI49551.1 endolytic transglycosylase MltG [Rhodospirillaceae bacterium]
MRYLKWAVAILALSILLAAGAVGYAFHLYTRPGPLQAAGSIDVPKGVGMDRVIREMAAAGVIDHPDVFRAWVRILGADRRVKAGEYRFPPKVSQREALGIVIAGRTVLRRLTVPEGLTTWQILERIRQTPGLSGAIALRPGEGALMPDTYLFAKGETRDAIVRRMQAAMTEALDRAWAGRAPDLPLRTKREALVLASIVEKETGKPDERARIAGVFVNRLRRGMRLETDPTVIYGLTEGKAPLGRRLLRKDLKTPHKWNTYVHRGLPPTPIANPGRDALAAAVRPMKHDELYFVADGTGGHRFSKTYRQHLRDVRKWRKIRRRLEREGKR